MIREVVYVLAIAVMVAAARQRAWYLSTALALHLAASATRLALLPALSPPVPLGLAALDSALFLAWPCALAAVALRSLAGTSPAPAILCLPLAALAAAALPGHLARVYLAAELAAGAAAVLSAARWLLSDRPATRERVALAILAVGHVVVVLGGAYRVDIFTRWDLHRAGYAVLLTAVLVVLLYPGRPRG